MDTCPDCRLPVRWVRLTTGALLTLEPDPHPYGTVLPDPGGGPAAVPTAVERALLPAGTELYRAHAVSCLPDWDEAKPSPARRKQRKGG